MTAERCACHHYRFDHVKSSGQCDRCGCGTYESACVICGGSGQVQTARITTLADWSDSMIIDCPGCHD